MPEPMQQKEIDALIGTGGEASFEGLSSEDLDKLFETSPPMGLPDFKTEGPPEHPGPADEIGDIEMLYDVELNVRVELGRTRMSVEDILRLRKGSVVTFDKEAGAQVDILVNDRLVARGEVLVLNDLFCVRVTEVLSNKDRAVLLET
ncbi:MAG: flagellar motor switch protein FliN [Planctomycetota bacterium]